MVATLYSHVCVSVCQNTRDQDNKGLQNTFILVCAYIIV